MTRFQRAGTFVALLAMVGGVAAIPTSAAAPRKSLVKAAGWHTPRPGSAERKVILDAVRLRIHKYLRQPASNVRFEVQRLKVQRGAAFLMARPVQANGKPIDYRKTPYWQDIQNGVFDDQVVALVRRGANGHWRVVDYALGATDVPYEDWDRRYRVPRAIFR